MAEEQNDVVETELIAPGTNVAGYVIDGKIGEGGMGVVYGAHHPRIGKRVAIKVLSPAYCGDPSTVARFEQEARLVNEIKHPNIVDVFQFGELPERRSVFFVMEWLEGETLSARIERKALPIRTTVEILDVVCDALEAAHETGVIHRDLKSDNVFLVTVRGQSSVKLLDFGLAKLAGRNDPASIGKTRSGILVGTPAYMSPEQARGKSVDPRTDIYSLGVLAYKMLTGTLPFKADNAMDVIVQQLNAPVPEAIKLAPNTPPELSRLVARMMAKQPEARPTLKEIRALFAEVREQVRTSRAIAAERPPRSNATIALTTVGVLLAAVIAVIAVVLVAKHRDTAAETPAAAGSSAAPATAEAPAAGSGATAATPAAAPTITPIPRPAPAPPSIEFPPDPVGSSAGSAAKHHHHHHADGEPTEPAEPPPPEPPPADRPGTLLLMVDRASAIEIDGQGVAQSTRGGSFNVKPGHHEIRVTPPDHQPVTRSVDIEPGGTAVIRVDLGTAPGSAAP